MKRWRLAVLCAACAALGWGEANETLALTVETENADPGEAGVRLVVWS